MNTQPLTRVRRQAIEGLPLIAVEGDRQNLTTRLTELTLRGTEQTTHHTLDACVQTRFKQASGVEQETIHGQENRFEDKSSPTITGTAASLSERTCPRGYWFIYRVVAYSEWLKIRLTKSRRARRRSKGSSGGRHILKLRRIYRFLHVPGPHQPSTGTAAPEWSWLPNRAHAWLFPGRRSAVRLRKDGRTSD